MTLKKVLIVTYYWPPAGGPGVQRVLKFAKYLPQFGWQPIILTVKNGEYPALDPSLSAEIPAECKVYRSLAPEPNQVYKKLTGMQKNENIPVAVLSEMPSNWKQKLANWMRLNLFIPDAKLGWIPFAVRQGIKIIQSESPQLILSSSPPPTVHLIARILARRNGLQWIADFRDPWSNIHYYQYQRAFISQQLDAFLERKILQACDHITCVSQQFFQLLQTSPSHNYTIITNGFDKEEKPGSVYRPKVFTLVYVGGLNRHRYYPRFFKDIQELIQCKVIDQNKLQILFVGKVTPSVKQRLKLLFKGISCYRFLGYLPHNEALKYMNAAHVLLLFLENVPEYSGHIPGKLFEYMMTGKEILGIGDPRGATADILATTGSGTIYDPDQDFKSVLEKLYSRWRSGYHHKTQWNKIRQYSRRNLTRRLAQTMEQLKWA